MGLKRQDNVGGLVRRDGPLRNGGVSIPSAGLVYKHTDTPVDGIVPDASGQGNDLILKTGWAVTLDGITGQVNFPTESAYDIVGKTLIVSGKFRFSTLPASNYSLIGKGFNLGGWMVYIKSDGRMAFISKRAGLGANHSIKRSTSVCPRDVWNTFTLTAVDGVMTGMVLNGANETIVTDLATAGTYGDYTTADLTIGAIQSVPTSTVTYFFAGDLCDFSMTVDGVEVLHPKLQDHPPGSLDGLPAFDASGNGNHGTYVGGTSINGEGMPIPQTALQDWNRRMWFDGVNDSSDTDFQITASNFGIYFKNIYIPSSLSDSILFASKGGLGLWVQILSGVLQLQFRGAGVLSTGYTLPLSEFYDLAIEYAPTTYTIKKDGITVKTGTFAGTITNPGQVFTVGSYNSGRYFKGYIERITFTQSDVFVGEWVNSTASFVGSPANIYLPEASDNPGFDALGNAIANPRGELLNPRGVAGDYAEILDDPSLDVTTEWSGAIVGNLWDDEDTDKRIIHRWDGGNSKRAFVFTSDSGDIGGDGSIRVSLSSDGIGSYTAYFIAPNRNAVISWSYNGTAGTLFVYIDGVKYTPTTVSGTIPASLFTTDIPIRLFQDFNGASPSDKQIGKTLMYNKALSDSEHVKIYRALRRYL
jgi:hypothetical protein